MAGPRLPEPPTGERVALIVFAVVLFLVVTIFAWLGRSRASAGRRGGTNRPREGTATGGEPLAALVEERHSRRLWLRAGFDRTSSRRGPPGSVDAWAYAA